MKWTIKKCDKATVNIKINKRVFDIMSNSYICLVCGRAV